MEKLVSFLIPLGFLRENSIYYIGGSDVLPPPLKGEAERLAVEQAEQGSEDARKQLVEHNLRLVAHIIKKYYQAEDVEDLISIGTIGLIKGINTYKPDKNVRLATYASRCIENATLT